jgi:Family of unknown function (DUF6152)
VEEFAYVYPHAWLYVMVTDDNGEETLWGFEAEGPSALMRAGIKNNEQRAAARGPRHGDGTSLARRPPGRRLGQRHKGGRDGAGAAPDMGQGLVATPSQLRVAAFWCRISWALSWGDPEPPQSSPRPGKRWRSPQWGTGLSPGKMHGGASWGPRAHSETASPFPCNRPRDRLCETGSGSHGSPSRSRPDPAASGWRVGSPREATKLTVPAPRPSCNIRPAGHVRFGQQRTWVEL